MAMGRHDPSLVEQILDGVSLTVSAGTARLRHGSRRDGRQGPLASEQTCGEGEIDFQKRRAWHTALRIGPGVPPLGEELWDGTDHFVREAPGERWMLLPFFGLPAGLVPYTSPFFLLDALAGAREDAHLLEGGSASEGGMHVRLTIEKALAVERSAHGLGFPPTRAPVDAFPGEVWLDEGGRIARMACAAPTRPPRWVPRRLAPEPRWIVTEFWDFGIVTAIPTPASRADAPNR